MKRRLFIQNGAAAFMALPFASLSSTAHQNPSKPAWLVEWIKIYDESIANYRSLKVIEVGHRYAGGYKDDAEIPNPHTTSGFIITACMLMSCQESRHYQSVDLLKEVEAAAQCMLTMQHSDGTIDLLATNFHSTPDTAFVLENMVPAYRYLKKMTMKSREKSIDLVTKFLKNAGEALIVGGIHTPNHRWVVSAALTKLNELFPDVRYVNRVEQWLAEHIDIDPDGQYNEKSTNTYSPIVNRSLIIIAKGLRKPELLEPVRRNLLMTLYFVHPNGEVVTEASNRQDKGTIGNMSRYYFCYRYMALHDKDGLMAAMCRQIEQTSTKAQLAGYLDYFLEDTSLWEELPTSKPLPISYAKAFPYSGVVRIRRENWDATILAKNAGWLTFHKGNSVLQAVRVAASFFGKGQFQTEKIEQEGDTWVLKQTLDGPYYQPFTVDKIAADGDWDKMPRNDRPQSEVQKLDSTIRIKEVGNGLELQIELKGTDGVPVSLELIFRAGGEFSGVVPYTKRANAYLFDGNEATYTLNGDAIRFGKGRTEHKGVVLRGALPPLEAPTVYLTGFTPFTHTIRLD